MKPKKTRVRRPVTARKPPDPPKESYVFRLFVAGASARSQQVILRVRQLCETELKGCSTLEVIDIYQQPQLARDYQIIATPTLIKESPKPVQWLIGNLITSKLTRETFI